MGTKRNEAGGRRGEKISASSTLMGPQMSRIYTGVGREKALEVGNSGFGRSRGVDGSRCARFGDWKRYRITMLGKSMTEMKNGLSSEPCGFPICSHRRKE